MDQVTTNSSTDLETEPQPLDSCLLKDVVQPFTANFSLTFSCVFESRARKGKIPALHIRDASE